MSRIGMLITTALVLIGAGIFYMAQSPAPDMQAQSAQGAPLVDVVVPDTLSEEETIGKRGFDAICAACHGENAAGRNGMGPPLVHQLYVPGHHGDMAFVLAVQNGVAAHHWPFGNMPVQQGLTETDIRNITAYVRALQRANGF